MQKELHGWSPQDADTAVLEMEACPLFSRVLWPVGERGIKGSVFSFTFRQCPGRKGQWHLSLAGRLQTCWRREFVVIALTGFKAVNDSGLSATNLSACLLFTKLLFYGPLQEAAACLSTDQEIISVKHWLQWYSHTKAVPFRALIYCIDLNGAVNHMACGHMDPQTHWWLT